MSTTPIADHALLSDCHSSALVDRDGSVEWLTFPRFDSPSVMARLLDDDGGHWAITPVGERETAPPLPRQDDGSRDDVHDGSGTLVLTDALAMGPDDEGHASARTSRTCWCAHSPAPPARSTCEVSYAPRPEYGLVVPLLSAVAGGVTARAARSGSC